MLSNQVKKLSLFSLSASYTSSPSQRLFSTATETKSNPEAIPQSKNLKSFRKKLKLFPIFNFMTQLSNRLLLFKQLNNYYYSQFRVKPKGAIPLLKNEAFIAKCLALEIPYGESRKIIRFVGILDLQIPENLSQEEVRELQAKCAFFIEQHKTHYKEFLRDELKDLENQTTPLKNEYLNFKSSAETFAENWMTVGTLFLLSQIAGLSYYMAAFQGFNSFQVTLAAAGFSTVCMKGTFLRELISQKIFTSKFTKLSKNHEINLSKLALLQQEINQVRSELISLN